MSTTVTEDDFWICKHKIKHSPKSAEVCMVCLSKALKAEDDDHSGDGYCQHGVDYDEFCGRC